MLEVPGSLYKDWPLQSTTAIVSNHLLRMTTMNQFTNNHVNFDQYDHCFCESYEQQESQIDSTATLKQLRRK
eukprot:gene5904-9088_t